MKRIFNVLTVIILFFYILIYPYEIAYHVRSALKQCAISVIPSLFMFIVFSKILSQILKNCNFKSVLSIMLSRLFGVPVSLLPVCLFGLVCGAPSGSVAICDLYSSGLCTKEEAERALVLSNNCSAAFILSIASSALESRRLSVLLLISNIMTTLFIYFIFFRKKTVSAHFIKKDKQIPSLSHLISTSIQTAVISCINLGGYIIFFYTLAATVSDRLYSFINPFLNKRTAQILKTATKAFFEMTSGTIESASIYGNIRAVLISASVAFCGLSIIFQVKSICNEYGISTKAFIISKILCCITCPIFTIVLMLLLPSSITANSTFTTEYNNGLGFPELFTFIFLFAVFISGVSILAYLDKRHKK